MGSESLGYSPSFVIHNFCLFSLITKDSKFSVQMVLIFIYIDFLLQTI